MTQYASYRKAIFANIENILDSRRFFALLDQYRADYDVFVSKHFSTEPEGLFTGVDASYLDYDYVIYIDPPKRSKNESKRNCAARQEYYLYAMLEDRRIADSMIGIMQEQSLVGMLSYPIDYVQSSNWEQYENWADYFKLSQRWLRENDLHVPTAIDKPPLSPLGGCAVIRCKAIENLATLQFKLFGSNYVGYLFALLCQSNGYLPQYAITSQMVVHNCLGYEASSSWMNNVLEIKKRYYKQLENYNQEREEYYEKLSRAFQAQAKLRCFLGYNRESFRIIWRYRKSKIIYWVQLHILRKGKKLLQRFLPDPIFQRVMRIKRRIFGPKDFIDSSQEDG
jgi:hypothetical protein